MGVAPQEIIPPICCWEHGGRSFQAGICNLGAGPALDRDLARAETEEEQGTGFAPLFVLSSPCRASFALNQKPVLKRAWVIFRRHPAIRQSRAKKDRKWI